MQPGDLCCQLSAKPCRTAADSCVRSCALSQLLCCDQLNSNQCPPSLSQLNIILLLRLWSNHLTTRPSPSSRPALPPTPPTPWSSLTWPATSPSSRPVSSARVQCPVPVQCQSSASTWSRSRTAPCSSPGTRWTRTRGLSRGSTWSRSPPSEETWGHSHSAQRRPQQLVRATETSVHISIFSFCSSFQLRQIQFVKSASSFFSVATHCGNTRSQDCACLTQHKFFCSSVWQGEGKQSMIKFQVILSTFCRQGVPQRTWVLTTPWVTKSD